MIQKLLLKQYYRHFYILYKTFLYLKNINIQAAFFRNLFLPKFKSTPAPEFVKCVEKWRISSKFYIVNKKNQPLKHNP